jgi:hypothetical protein
MPQKKKEKENLLPSSGGNVRIRFPPNNKYRNELCLSKPLIGMRVI